jgi:phage terminase large subunit
VPWEPRWPVVTAWDLGIDDVTAIVFAQVVGREVRVIDYYEAQGRGSHTTRGCC